MNDYAFIEYEMAKKYGSSIRGTQKSIGDFLLNDDAKKPVNVKSNNIKKNNYSPNIISAKRLVKWLLSKDNELYFIFVDYQKTSNEIEIINDSGPIKVEHLNWECLRIEAQGWGVIQMAKPLKIDLNQDRKLFFKGLKRAYEIYINKENKKIKAIVEMIKDL